MRFALIRNMAETLLTIGGRVSIFKSFKFVRIPSYDIGGNLIRLYMKTSPIPSNCPESLELTCKEIVMAMLGNAIEELRYHITHPISKDLRSSYFGYIKNPLGELRWFLTSPEGGEMLAASADISSVFQKYRRKAMPLLLEAEALAEATKAAHYNVFPFYNEALSQNPMKRHRYRRFSNLYSNVDILSYQQDDFFLALFSQTSTEDAL